jgi:ribosomal protein L11 methyltransferase
MNHLEWIEITITTKTESVEAISYMLTDVGITGIMIDDPKDILLQDKDETAWDYVEEELLQNKDPETVFMTVYLPENMNYQEKIQEIKERLQHIGSFLDIGKGTVEINNIDEEEWAHSWKKYYKPLKVGKSIIIKPSWEQYEPANEDEKIIEMDPGMAFGTGTHETTSMCIELLEKCINNKEEVLDIGCGSGILGIAAAKLGAKHVIGVDLDTGAVKVAKENVRRNQLEDKVEIRHGNLLDVVEEKGDIVVANIIADIIIQLSQVVPRFLKTQGYFISSGIIRDRLDEVKQSIEQGPFEILEVKEKGEWAAIVAQMKE